ncbi:hypothetical protein C7A07_24915 [Pseudomonas fragi]|nr:hypothetical protein C7A07_24915 [Pseudomonas fragi]
MRRHCGSGLARDGIATVCLTAPCACIAGKPAPTGFTATLWERACSRWHRHGLPDSPLYLYRRQASSHWTCGDIVGAGLLAMASPRFA